MSEIRERLEAHRLDALVLLGAISTTATLHSGFRLAGAVGHIARAQALLAEELFSLPGESKPEKTAAGEPAGAGEDETPIDGIHSRNQSNSR